MIPLPRDHQKTFWSAAAAERFFSALASDGYKPEIWNEYDRLNKCSIYIVMWDNK